MRSALAFSLIVLLATCRLASAAPPTITPTAPPSMAINVAANGKSEKLTLDAPELHTFEVARDKKTNDLPDAPNNFQPYFDDWDSWPGQEKVIGLSPHYDEEGTLILGGLWRSFRPETVEVKSEDGATVYKKDVDYVYNAAWGQVANKDGHLKGKVQAKGEAALSRIDLVERDNATGKVSVKKGKSAWVCPTLPDADPGCVAVAGIYIAPWRVQANPFYDGADNKKPLDGASEYAVTEHEIFPIHDVTPPAPVHPDRVRKILAKMRAGQPVKIAFMGASVSVGAEAPVWYNKKPYTEEDHSFRGRIIYGLRQRFPKADIQPIEAFKGATTVDYAMEQLPGVLAQKPDLIFVDFGVNDLGGPVGKPPKKPLADYEKSMEDLIKQGRSNGAEVVVIAPGLVMPWLKNGAGQRQPEYERASVEAADKQGAAAVLPFDEVQQLNARGIPYWSQIHNWINHPGDLGHLVYAQNILRLFPEKGDVVGATVAPAAASSNASSPTAGAATPATMDGAISVGAAQPEAVEGGKWRAEKQPLPPLDDIVKQPAPDRPVYGIYCWPDEYVKYHDFIKSVGWTTCRLGGSMSDDAMKLIAEDDMEAFMCLSGQGAVGMPADFKTGNRAKFDTDEAFIDAYDKRLTWWLERWGPGGSYFKEHPDVPNHPVKFIEVFNEPNFFYLDLPSFIAPKDATQMNEWNDKRQKLYSKLLPAAYETIKKVSPEVRVLGFGAGGAAHADIGFITKVHEDNPAVAKSYDILSTHPYGASSPPEMTSVAPWGTWSMAGTIGELKTLMQKFGTADKPIWYSELNWEITAEEGGHYKNDVLMHKSPYDQNTQQIQAAYIVRGYAYTIRLGVKRLTYMSIPDTDHCNSGMLNPDGSWRQSAHAVKTMIGVMPRPALRGAVSDGDDSTYIYRFNPDYKSANAPDVIMAWRATGPKTVEIPWTGTAVELVSMTGERQMFPVKDGKVKVKIGPCPVYMLPADS